MNNGFPLIAMSQLGYANLVGGGATPSPTIAASGKLPTSSNPAMIWVGLVILIVAWRVLVEMAGRRGE